VDRSEGARRAAREALGSQRSGRLRDRSRRNLLRLALLESLVLARAAAINLIPE
jgi:hypothetical protein